MGDLIRRCDVLDNINKRIYYFDKASFDEAVKAVCNAPSVDATPRWISVEERLPDGEVLAANFAPGTYGYKEYIIGYVSVVKAFEPDYAKGKCYATNDFEILNNVTHWMPLPEPPKEDA